MGMRYLPPVTALPDMVATDEGVDVDSGEDAVGEEVWFIRMQLHLLHRTEALLYWTTVAGANLLELTGNRPGAARVGEDEAEAMVGADEAKEQEAEAIAVVAVPLAQRLFEFVVCLSV
jgi:hypothetical protein